MNEYITFDGTRIYVGQRWRCKSTKFVVEVASLEEDPHWLCAVTLKEASNEPPPPDNFWQTQPYEYLLRNWEILR